MTIKLKGIPAIIAAVVTLAAGMGYTVYNRATLIDQGRPLAQKHIETEVVREKRLPQLQEGLASGDMSGVQSSDVTITEFRPLGFFPSSKRKVRVVAAAGEESKTYHFIFRSTLGSWRLVREYHPVLGSW